MKMIKTITIIQDILKVIIHLITIDQFHQIITLGPMQTSIHWVNLLVIFEPLFHDKNLSFHKCFQQIKVSKINVSDSLRRLKWYIIWWQYGPLFLWERYTKNVILGVCWQQGFNFSSKFDKVFSMQCSRTNTRTNSMFVEVSEFYNIYIYRYKLGECMKYM